MPMNKLMVLFAVGLLILATAVSAHITADEIKDVEALLASKPACTSLTDDQLELMGEYYMEQMHPGDAHELMHQMMGLEEDTEAEEQFHINMARRIYCGENTGMMGYGGGMMGSRGMMSGVFSSGNTLASKNSNDLRGGNMMRYGGYGMMGSGYGLWGVNSVLMSLLLLGLVAVVFLWAWKLWKETKTEAKKK